MGASQGSKIVTKNDTTIVYRILKWIHLLLFSTIVPIFSYPKIVSGLQNLNDPRLNGPLIISSNHDGRIDPVWIYYMIQIHSTQKPDMTFLAWHKYYDLPILGWYMKRMRCFRVESGKGLSVLDPVVEHLKLGGVTTIFPEGYIRKDSEKKRRAKRGIGYMILKIGAPILPIYIKYHRRKHWLGYWFEIRFGEIQEDLGKNKTEEDIQNIADKALQCSYDLIKNL